MAGALLARAGHAMHYAFHDDARPTQHPRMPHFDAVLMGFAEHPADIEPGADEAEASNLLSSSKRSDKSFYNGDHYIGETQGGRRSGHGAYYYQSGDKYVGQWERGMQNGSGVYTYANGDRYNGAWKEGKHHGKGTYYFKSGKMFVGEYKEGMPHGARASRARARPDGTRRHS